MSNSVPACTDLPNQTLESQLTKTSKTLSRNGQQHVRFTVHAQETTK
jgi:hypothetical protein